MAVEEREEEIVVTRKGRPSAVIINVAEYERLRETLEVLSDPALMTSIRRGRSYFRRGGKGVALEAVFAAATRRRRKHR